MNSNYTDEIIYKLNEYSNHPLLNKYFDMPNISEDKILFLQAIIEQAEISDKHKEKYIMATMLVQTALDMHDLVSNENNELNINKSKRQKQLNILVGDLYSGLFYELLSNLNDLPMINVLAGAIKEINERKMVLYQNEIHSINHLMEEIKKIESLLIEKVASFLNVSSLNYILPNWLLMKRLQKEQRIHSKSNNSYIVKLLSDRTAEHHTIRMIDNMICRTSHTLEALIKEMPLQFAILQELLLEDLKDLSYRKEILLEEG